MLKFNLAGSVQDELEKIAYEKGWVKSADFEALRKDQITNLQKLINKKLTGKEVGPVSTDGVWGPQTAAYYDNLKKSYPELPELYVNKAPSVKEINDVFRSMMESVSPKKENIEYAKNIPSGVPSAQVAKNFLPGKEKIVDAPTQIAQTPNKPFDARKAEFEARVEKEMGRGLSQEQAMQEALRQMGPRAKNMKGIAFKGQNSDDVPFDAKEKLKEEKIKYLMGQNYSEEQARQLVESEKEQGAVDGAGKKNEEAMQLAGAGVPTEEALKMVASNTISCLVSLADELDSLGEAKVAIAIDNQINFYKKAMDKLYDVTGETGEAFVNSAHTDHVTVAPAKEEGGKVENTVEQQKKDLEIANKNPTGKYAKTILELVATANRLDAEGFTEAAEKVDRAIYELQNKFPFANKKLANEAANFFGKKYASENSESFWQENFWDQIELDRYKILDEITEVKKGIKTDSHFGRSMLGIVDNLYNIINNSQAGMNKEVFRLKNLLSKYSKEVNSFYKYPTDPFFKFINSLNAFYNKVSSLEKQVTQKLESKETSMETMLPSQQTYYDYLLKYYYNLEKARDVFFNKTEQIGKAFGGGFSYGAEIADEFETEMNRIKGILKDPKLYKKTYDEVQDLIEPIYRLQDTVKSKFSFKSFNFVKTADFAETLSKLFKAFPSEQQPKAKAPGQKPAISKRVPGKGVGYNKSLDEADVKVLQGKLGVKEDGKYGPVTHAALFDRAPEAPKNFTDMTPQILNYYLGRSGQGSKQEGEENVPGNSNFDFERYLSSIARAYYQIVAQYKAGSFSSKNSYDNTKIDKQKMRNNFDLVQEFIGNPNMEDHYPEGFDADLFRRIRNQYLSINR